MKICQDTLLGTRNPDLIALVPVREWPNYSYSVHMFCIGMINHIVIRILLGLSPNEFDASYQFPHNMDSRPTTITRLVLV